MDSSDHRDLAAALRSRGLEVRDDAGTRSMYASDASLFRVPPRAVVRPRAVEEIAATLAVARETGTPVTARGAGTSVAGNAVGPGIVLDLSRHLGRVLEIDPQARTAVVEPGCVQATLQRAAAPYGLRFGPDPSTHTRCTIGGMIGNNACGSRSLAFGRTSDNVAGLRLLTAAGEAFGTSYDDAGSPVVDSPDGAAGADLAARLRETMRPHLATARTELGRFTRQVSGYAAEHLVPERFDLTRALVGSEGTLALVTQATVRLVTDHPHRVVVVLGYDDIVAAGRAAPAVVAHQPSCCEGLDARLTRVLTERRGPGAVPPLPGGNAWLFVEFAGADPTQVLARAHALVADGLAADALVVQEPAHQAALWRIREDGAGLAGRSPAGRPAWPGWEDAAVPPAMLGDYLARFDELVAAHGMTSAPFGHFGEGCMHVRLDFPLDRPDGTRVMREFLTDAARLVGQFGGSLSGEHGDGRARSELLPLMYSPDALAMFADIKAAFDPGHLLNPGVLVDPDPVDGRLRPVGRPSVRPVSLAYPDDGGDLAHAVHRCTGVGRCRADNRAAGGVMCPSYLATREEKDSTRGRARVLQDVVSGQLAWDAPEVHAALDLCLSCKGCASDCPTGVDMATYKSEALHQAYRRRLRPRSHYTLGRLPMWTRLAGALPRVSNLAMRLPVAGPAAKWLAGVDGRRSVPAFARRTFRRDFSGDRGAAGGAPVVLFADSFTDAFAPQVGHAAVRVLQDAGYDVQLPAGRVCCGLTWLTTGQLDAARRILGATVAALAPAARAGAPVVVLEPSCAAVLRHDVHQLLPGSPDARAVAGAVVTLAELLSRTDGWTPPDLSGRGVVAQPHCHHHAVLGWQTDAELLEATGAQVTRLAGCCGLAGNFGVERGHYEVSVAVAGQHLLPALDAEPEATVLADGFSCRTQVADLRGRDAVHLAQLLDPASPPPG